MNWIVSGGEWSLKTIQSARLLNSVVSKIRALKEFLAIFV
jgi:hypothetical protein